jgi:hypothetical protein
MDANFRLRRKKVSTETKDPSLSQGYSYFVKTAPYLAHIEEYTGDKQEVCFLIHSYSVHIQITLFQPSSCVSHDAVTSADTKEVHGCSVTGVGAVDCSRHEFRRPNSVGDLQKGER